MRKALPKLKKTVTSFIVEEDAKLMDKSASKVAISAAFISSIVLLNMDSANAAPWDHKDHYNHSNNLEKPLVDDVKLVNLGDSNSVITYNLVEEFEVKVTKVDQIIYGDQYHFKVPQVIMDNFPQNMLPMQSHIMTASDYQDNDFSMITTHYTGVPGIEAYNITVDFDLPQSLNDPIYVKVDDTVQELNFPTSNGNTDSTTIVNDRVVEVSARTQEKSISAVHSNHYDHSNKGGWGDKFLSVATGGVSMAFTGNPWRTKTIDKEEIIKNDFTFKKLDDHFNNKK